MFTEAQNDAIVRTLLDRVFFQAFDEKPMVGQATADSSELFKPLKINMAAYTEAVYNGMTYFDATGEAAPVPNDTPQVNDIVTTYVSKFAKGVEITKELFDDEMFGTVQRMMTDMGQAARKTMDRNAFDVFNNAFTTTIVSDGSALIGARVLYNGQPYDNTIAGALSPTTLNSAYIALTRQPNRAGLVMGSRPAILLVPPEQWKHATEITQSTLHADTANNNINVYQSQMGIKVMTSPFLSSTTAWFLLGNNHSVTRLLREPITTYLRPWGMSNNQTYWYQASFREQYYAVDYAGIVGSTGV